ncbi:biopolymer transporter ExbD [Waterburya agarophytonicola K14]|uniref:Biopolymer transporter ExbD n=1 Tax=Waterburya agarophytonicola KI4 TaxID=2874699 RepID=A0A964FDX8_9CYAN|nr:biopolymer transporter ExbD [Waterburya agarophytonicola]MCC0176095.1 biopolymer transporter ExbD [Waterburya agarophytonicola KI4]
MRLLEEPDLPPTINILPMIDVIFAILVFFIVSSLYLTRSEGLPVNLPRASTTEVQKTKQITVSLDSEGKLSIDSKATQISQLKTEIEKLIQSGDTTTVVINADKTVEHGLVVDAIDRIRQIPKIQLAIAAKKPD